MEGRKPRSLAVVALAAQGFFAGAVGAADSTSQPTAQELQSRMNALQAQLDQMKAEQAKAEKHEREVEQQATLNSVLNDAEHRDKLLDVTGITGGYDNKAHRFFLQSDDGNFVWRPWLHMQFRDVTSLRKDQKFPGNDEVDNGFEMRRMRFGFDGNMFSPDLTYFFNWATVRANGSSTLRTSTGSTVSVSNNLGGVPLLEEAWVKYNFHNTPFYIWAGQIKDPVEHDQIISSRYQHGVERSLIGDIFFNGDAFTEGATFIYDPKTDFRGQVGVNHGMRAANTNFFDYPTQNAYNYGVVGRAEYKFFGRWADYGQIGAIEVKQPLLVAGIGTDYSERGHAGQIVSAADVNYADPSGLSFYGAFANRYTNHNFGIYTQSPTGASIIAPPASVAGHATEEYGILGEVGYVFNNFIEPYGRFEYMHLQGTPIGSQNWIPVITGGVNFYFQGNRFKLTPQVIYLPKGIPIDDGPSDVYTTKPGKGEIVGEIQLQILI